jgi:predicted DNA-binding transcriptional regulator AlpA
MNDRLLLRPAEAADAIGVSRSRAYELIADGTLPQHQAGIVCACARQRVATVD